MIYATIQAILLFGMPQSLLYYFPRKEVSEQPNLIKQTWMILAISGLFQKYYNEAPLAMGPLADGAP